VCWFRRQTADLFFRAAQSERIDKISKSIFQHSLIPEDEDPAPFNVPNQSSIIAVGQVLGEGEGLNEKTLMLQRGNVRAKIDLTDMKSYSLFSGQVRLRIGYAFPGKISDLPTVDHTQVVAIKGVNAYGSRIVVEAIHHDATLPHFSPASFEINSKEEMEYRRHELRVMIASGPFTARSDMFYEPLDDLLNKVQERKPHALILVRFRELLTHWSLTHSRLV
jgi:hypothetical protein